MLNQNYIIYPKMQYNYSNNNIYIIELLIVYSVVADGGFLWSDVNILVNHKCGT